MKKKFKKQESEKLIIQKARNTKIIIAALAVLFCVAVVYWVKFTRMSGAGLKKSLYSRTIGNPKADIRVVEHADFQCSPCAKGYFLLKDHLKEYPEKFQIEFKYHPWTHQRHALGSAVYAECAAQQGKFWKYTELLFKRQNNWKLDAEAEIMFREMARETGLDEFILAECVSDDTTKEKILSERKKGEAMGIRRTPTFYVNGKMIVGEKSLVIELNKLLQRIEK